MSTAALPFEPPRLIRRKVSRLRLAVRAYVLVEGLAALAIVVGAAFWLALGVDWVFEPSPAARLVMWIAVATIAAIVAWRFIMRRLFAALRNDSLALLVERKFPHLAEGFVTTVQAEGESRASSLRRAMLDASAGRTAELLRNVPLARVFDFGPLVRKLLTALILIGAIVGFALTSRDAFTFWLQRMRLSPELWPRVVSLKVLGFEETDDRRVVNVARDDAYELQVLASIVDGHKAPEEVEVRWRLADGRRGRGSMTKVGEATPGRNEAQLYQYAFKVSADVEFDVVGGDDRIRGLRLHPVERPTIRDLAIQCDYPEYLGRISRLLPFASGRVELPEGSSAVCRAKSNKPLVEVTVRDPATQSDLPVRISPDDALDFDFDLGTIAADRVLLITMRDADGVQNRDPFRLIVRMIADQPPEVNVQLRGIGSAVTPQARIPLAGRLLDDHALTDAWFEFQAGEEPAQRRRLRTPPDGVTNLRMTEAFDLAETDQETKRPRVEVEPGERLTLSVAGQDAYDLKGAPHVGASPKFQLDVVTASELRALLEKRELGLRQRFETMCEKMVGVRNLIDRIDLASHGDGADDSSTEEAESSPAEEGAQEAAEGEASDQSLSPARRRERDAARVNGLRQSATQLAFEITGIAEGFDGILAELVNNRVDTEELKERMEQGISEPLKEISGDALPRFDLRLAELQSALTADSPESAQSLTVAQAEAADLVDAMQAILNRMLELESYNELVEQLRGIVADHEALREETLRIQREKLRELLGE
jgi:hypothetical protein